MSNGKILYFDQATIDNSDSETIRFYPLKESEAIALLSQVEYMVWSKRWKNLTMTQEELEAFAGSVADNLMNPMEEGAIVTTPQELQDAVCNGIMCAVPQIGAVLSAGVNSSIQDNISIDEEGNIVVGDGSGSGSATGTAQEQKTGSAYEMAYGLQQILTDLDDFWTNYNADPNRDTIVQYYMELLYQWVDTAELLIAIDAYFNYRDAPNAGYVIDHDELAEDLYCAGLTKGQMSRWAITKTDATMDDIFLSIIKGIDQSEVDKWVEDGEAKLRDDYLNFACTPRGTATAVYGVADFNAVRNYPIDNWNFSSSARGRRIRVTMSGKFTPTTGEPHLQDAYWFDNGGGAVNYDWQHLSFSSSIGYVRIEEDGGDPAYNSESLYSFIAELAPANYTYITLWLKTTNAGIATINANPQGQVSITLEDLGEV